MIELEVGKEYDVQHSRKGKFRVRVHRVDGSIIDGEITSGIAHYFTEPDRVAGDLICIDSSKPFVVFCPVET